LEAIGYKADWDPNLRTWLRAGKTPKEMMVEAALAEELDGILHEITAETMGKPAEGNRKGGSGAVVPLEEAVVRAADAEANDSGAPLPEEQQLRLREFTSYAERLLSEHIRLIEEPETAATVREVLKGTAVVSLLGKGKTIGVLYAPQHAGEPATHPHLRVAPLRDDHVRKMVKGAPCERWPVSAPGANSTSRSFSTGNGRDVS
jgi:hypothetical protein